MSIRKTQRKNKTKQVITWPSNDDYFTVKSLVALNPHMLTSAPKPSDITLRVRLNKAINEENLVAVIGHKNCGKGRPELVFAMKPVKQTAIDKAKANNIMIDTPRLVTVMDISSQPKINIIPVTVTAKQAVNA
jgi:hypothetical protein